MKVLFVSHKHPWPLYEGTRHRLFHLAHSLAVEHKVTLLTLLPEEDREEGLNGFPLTELCERLIQVDSGLENAPALQHGSRLIRRLRRVRDVFTSSRPDALRRWECPKLLSILRSLRASDEFDVVWVARSYIAETVRRAGFEKIVVDVDDIESVSRARSLRLKDWSRAKLAGYFDLVKLYAFERTLPRHYWRLVVCKEEDRQFFGQSRDRVWVVPNGAADVPPTKPENEQPSRLLFLGTMGYEPNIDAVRYFAQSVMPELQRLHPAVQFHVVGKDPGPEVLTLHDGRSCFVHGFLSDITPQFESAAIVVAPIRSGSGTRLKVLEALARGKAVVGTSMAIEGLDLQSGLHLEVADTPQAFATACDRLLADPGLRRRLGEAGRQRVLERYGWDAIGVIARSVIAGADTPSQYVDVPGVSPRRNRTCSAGRSRQC